MAHPGGSCDSRRWCGDWEVSKVDYQFETWGLGLNLRNSRWQNQSKSHVGSTFCRIFLILCVGYLVQLPVSGRQRVRLFTKAILFRPESFQYALGLPIHWPWLSKTPVELHLYGMLPRGLVKRPWWLFKQGMTWKRLILCWDLLNITAKNRPIRWEKPLILTKYYILL